ncbi:S8 family serine peptidase [Rhizohabitans arisaemae]|uniref:S8 family serine peptidase n=1 Tax=Rhizohabitans arisaemae TaxID=2720610 RepID=UPI0024B1D3DB|nr:S8 family serine peptidase [Rhizohabitans arisaemae]
MLTRAVAGIALTAVALLAPACAAAADDVASAVRLRQWPLAELRVPAAWKHARGENVVVAVLDTGVDERHPDLLGAVIPGPDLVGGARRAGRYWGHHGTAMASLIAGRGHGPGRARGVIGIAPAAKILSIRVTLENGDPLRQTKQARRQSENAVAAGIRYAADQGADVISMSLGGGRGVYDGSADEEEAVQYALAKGAVLVASSGNDGADANRKNFPAAYPGVIAVGAVDRNLRRAPFSNRQGYLSVVAPGTQIVSADGADSYVVGDGTSAAAAHVAGVAALIRGRFPELTPLEVRRAIERSTVRRPKGGHDAEYGHGLVNAERAVDTAGLMAERSATGWDDSGTTVITASEHTEYFGGGPTRSAPISRRVLGLTLVLLAALLAAGAVLTERHYAHRR